MGDWVRRLQKLQQMCLANDSGAGEAEPFHPDENQLRTAAEQAAAGEPSVRVTAFVHGRVQGVGFRWWVRGQAKELNLVGSARNLDDGRVVVVAEGHVTEVVALVTRLWERPSEHLRPGRVDTVVPQWQRARGVTGFEIS